VFPGSCTTHSSSHRPPETNRFRLQSSLRVVAFRVPSTSPPVGPLSGLDMPTQGLFPPRGTSQSVHSHGDCHASASFRPQAFSASRRLSPLHDPWACSIPRPRPGFIARPGVRSLRAADPPRRKIRAPLVFGDRRAHSPCDERPPLGRLPFEALLHTEARCPRHEVNRDAARSPPRVPVPSRRSSILGEDPFPVLPPPTPFLDFGLRSRGHRRPPASASPPRST